MNKILKDGFLLEKTSIAPTFFVFEMKEDGEKGRKIGILEMNTDDREGYIIGFHLKLLDSFSCQLDYVEGKQLVKDIVQKIKRDICNRFDGHVGGEW